MRVASIGDNCLDVYVEQGLLAVGGNAANVAATFAWLGMESTYIGAVGQDAAADIVRDAVSASAHQTDLHVLPGRTGVTLIRLHGDDREFLHEDFGVGRTWRPDDATLDQVRGVDWVHVAGTATDASVRHRLVRQGHRVSVDLSVEPVPAELDGLEIVFASWSPEWAATPQERAKQILAAGAGTAVVTSGSRGSLAMTGSRVETFDGLPVVPVDTCGAGDSFIAGFVTARLRGNRLLACLAAGAAVASSTCLYVGGFPQILRAIPTYLLERYGEFLPDGIRPAGSIGGVSHPTTYERG